MRRSSLILLVAVISFLAATATANTLIVSEVRLKQQASSKPCVGTSTGSVCIVPSSST